MEFSRASRPSCSLSSIDGAQLKIKIKQNPQLLLTRFNKMLQCWKNSTLLKQRKPKPNRLDRKTITAHTRITASFSRQEIRSILRRGYLGKARSSQ
jgi:hypothetical protein